MFRDLFNLKYLVIDSNKELKKITRDTFKSLVSVERVELIECGISQIGLGAFKSLHNLKFLDLRANKLTKFSLTDLPVNLEHLNLSQNQIKFVNSHGLLANSKLLMLNLSSNKLELLPEGAFSSLVALRSLDLAWNELSSISSEAFSGLYNLRELDLKGNKFKVLKNRVFEVTKNLKKLFLGTIQLECVEPDAFSHLSQKLRVILDEERSSFEVLKPFEKNSKIEFEFDF
jgi:Leucine-rich repeat (LRR) protein